MNCQKTVAFITYCYIATTLPTCIYIMMLHHLVGELLVLSFVKVDQKAGLFNNNRRLGNTERFSNPRIAQFTSGGPELTRGRRLPTPDSK